MSTLQDASGKLCLKMSKELDVLFQLHCKFRGGTIHVRKETDLFKSSYNCNSVANLKHNICYPETNVVVCAVVSLGVDSSRKFCRRQHDNNETLCQPRANLKYESKFKLKSIIRS